MCMHSTYIHCNSVAATAVPPQQDRLHIGPGGGRRGMYHASGYVCHMYTVYSTVVSYMNQGVLRNENQ